MRRNARRSERNDDVRRRKNERRRKHGRRRDVANAVILGQGHAGQGHAVAVEEASEVAAGTGREDVSIIYFITPKCKYFPCFPQVGLILFGVNEAHLGTSVHN